MTSRNTKFFPKELEEFITSSFSFLNNDPYVDDRMFFENAGGALRLKSVVDAQSQITALPDNPDRPHKTAVDVRDIIKQGTEDVRLFLNAKDGSIATGLTASKLMFEIVSTIADAAKPGNIITTSIEHPSSYDACAFAAEQNNHELRVAQANPISGSIPLENILSLVDEDTILVSVILTSNITGAMHDIKKYSQAIKEKNPETIIVVDGVQGAPHGVIDVDDWGIDAINIAPYKMFGNRGVGFAYLSDRIASLPHHRLLATDTKNWDVGSPTPTNYISFTKIIDYICEIGQYFNSSTNRRLLIVEGMHRIHLQEQAILNRLINGSDDVLGVKDIQNVTVHFEEENGVHQDLILALTFDNISCADAVEIYGEHNILVFARESSSYYSQRILEAVNLDSIVRVSPIHCHTAKDIDRFLQVTKLIAENQ